MNYDSDFLFREGRFLALYPPKLFNYIGYIKLPNTIDGILVYTS